MEKDFDGDDTRAFLTEIADDIPVMIRRLTPEETVHLPEHQGEPLYAVCDENGKCLAISNNRYVAFAFAKDNGMVPAIVH